MSLEGRRVLAATTAALRLGARVFLEHGSRANLIGFRIADTHLHALLLCARALAGAFVHRVECALGWSHRPGAAFEQPHFEPVHTQSHLTRAFWYVLRQEEHHGTGLDPLHEGSSLFDTLGLRVVDPAFAARVRRALPRAHHQELAALLAPNALALLNAPDPGPSALPSLADAAAAALALSTVRHGFSADSRTARRCAVAIALEKLTRDELPRSNGHARAIAEALDLSLRSAERLIGRAAAKPNAELTRAVRLQWRLRAGLARQRPHGHSTQNLLTTALASATRR